MRRLKTYLCSSMSQKRLNHTLIISCHKSRVDSLNFAQIALDFISVNEGSLFWREIVTVWQRYGIIIMHEYCSLLISCNVIATGTMR